MDWRDSCLRRASIPDLERRELGQKSAPIMFLSNRELAHQSQVFWLQSCVFRNPAQNPATQLVVVVKGEFIVGPALPSQ